MLQERYDQLLNEEGVIRGGDTLLSDRIDSRKSYFRRMGMGGGRSSKRYRSGVYRHGNMQSSKPISQRVLVKAHYKKHSSNGMGGAGGSGGSGKLRAHLSYITRSGAGVDEERPVLFGSMDGEKNHLDFYHACKDDRHHFRFIISPENGHEIDDMQGYITGVLGQIEKDLGTKLEWMSAVHYDTDNVHAHVVVRGKDDLGKDLVIAPDYISNGIRMRAEELATEILGERNIEVIQKSMEKEVGALRFTSLDRFIEGQGRDGVEEIIIDTREKNYSGRGAFYDGLVVRRLEFLTTTAMAVQEPRGVFVVRRGYGSELRDMSERHDIIKQLHRSMPDEDKGVLIYDAGRDDAENIRGRIDKIAHVNELTDHKYMVVRDGLERAHYVPLALNGRSDALLEGQIVEVSSGKSTGGADANIAFIASQSDGVYTRAAHLEHVRSEMSFIEDAESYVDYHGVRLETLEKSDIVERDDDGFKVPDDVVKRGAALNKTLEKSGWKKKAYGRVKVLTPKPLEVQVNANARTWLDLEIYRHQKGHDLAYKNADKGTMDAVHKRMEWLAEHGYGEYSGKDGEFMMRGDALKRLYAADRAMSGQKLCSVLDRQYVDLIFENKTTMRYLGYADMHAGRHVILSSSEEFTLVKMPKNMGDVRINEPVEIEKANSGFTISKSRQNLSLQEAIDKAREKSGLSYKDINVQDNIRATYLGAVNLEEGVYGVVKHEDEISFIKLKNYPVIENNSKIEITAGNVGFGEIQELELDSDQDLEKTKDNDVEIDW